jgi:hypothetical protein
MQRFMGNNEKFFYDLMQKALLRINMADDRNCFTVLVEVSHVGFEQNLTVSALIHHIYADIRDLQSRRSFLFSLHVCTSGHVARMGRTGMHIGH